MLRVVLTMALVMTTCLAATMTEVRAWQAGANDVALTAAVQGEFSSVFLGSIAQLVQAAMGGSWRIHYKVELRREVPNWPDKVVASDVYTYEINFPISPDEEITVGLASNNQGSIASTSVSDGRELANVVQHLGRIGGSDHVALAYDWTPDDGGRDFHIRVKASMEIPIEKDDQTDWMDSPSFTVPKEECPAGEGEKNLGETVTGAVGMNNAPRVPSCCNVASYSVKAGDPFEISYSSFDSDNDRFVMEVNWSDGTATNRSDYMGGSSEWNSATFLHRFNYVGEKRITARAVDEHGKVSDWSDPVIISVE